MDDIKKSNFIKELTTMTKEEIDDFLKRKGKEPKLIPLIYFVEKEK